MKDNATPKKITVSEKTIENSILSFLKLHGYFVFKVESQGTYDAKLGRYRLKHSIHRMRGVADIIGLTPSGQFLAIEVKSAKGRVNDYQKAFIDSVIKSGGIAFIARSIDDVKSQLNITFKNRIGA